jgi:hypothetical protein
MGTGDRLDPAKTKPLPAGSVAIMQPKLKKFGRLDTSRRLAGGLV